MSPLVRRTWAPRGQTPILLQRGRTYQKVSMIAAVTVAPQRIRTGLYFGLHVDRNIKGPQVEYFWSYLKMNPLANLALTDVDKLAYAARYHSSKIKRQSKIIRSFLYASSLFCHK